MIAWRITKIRYAPFDGAGARTWGGRWNSSGRPVIYGADTFAGAVLEIIAHALRPRTLPGLHHAVRITIPEDSVESVTADDVPGWAEIGSPAATALGDYWFDSARSPALRVPSLPARPVGGLVLINPLHPDADAIEVSPTFPVPWDERLF